MNNILSRQKVSEQFLLDYINDINWHVALRSLSFSENFLNNLKNNMDFDDKLCYMQKHCKLSEDFIKRHKKNLDQDLILRYQNISESFIKDNLDYFLYKDIYRYRTRLNLSNEFILTIKKK